MFDGDIGQCRLVTLHVRELSPHLIRRIKDQHTQVVGSHPEITLRVIAHFPYDNVIRHILIALGTHQFGQRGVPAFFLLQIDIGTGRVSDDPDILFLVHRHPIIIVGIKGTLDIVLLPDHLALLAVDTHEFTIGRHQNHAFLTFGIGRYAKLLGKLIGSVAKRNMGEIT